MDPTLSFLISYALGVTQNASWDAIKWTVGKITGRQKIDFGKLWIRSFYEALDIHSAQYDEVAHTYANLLRNSLKKKPEELIGAIQTFTYDNYGLFIASLHQRQFQSNLAAELIRRCQLESDEDSHNLLVSIITDVIARFRIAIIRLISRDEELRIVLLQTLKIDSIKASLETLQNEIITKDFLAYSFIEAKNTLVAEIKGYLDQYLHTFKEAKEQIESTSLKYEKEIVLRDFKRLLKAKGFHPISITQEGVDLVAESRGVILTRIALKIDVDSVPTKLADVLTFKAYFPRTDSRYGYYISKSGFEAEALQQSGIDPSLKMYSLDNFLNSLVDFDDYLNSLIQKYEESPLNSSNLYEPIQCYSADIPAGSNLLSVIDSYLHTGTTRMLAILGDFGTGKTTFCSYYSYVLAKRYQEQSIGNYIPVVVPLKKYDRVADIGATIVQVLQHHGVDINIVLLTELLNSGKFIFLFDGFDEMTLRSDKLTILQNLRTLQEIAQIGDNRFILTCRTHFFRDGIEENNLDGYKILYLQDWTKKQIENYLAKKMGSSWIAVRNRILNNPALWELSKTPLFLEMVVASIPDIQSKEVSASDLFRIYTNKWINDQDHRSRMTIMEKRSFMSLLARLLFYGDKFSVHYSELREVVRETFKLQVIEDVDYFDNDVRTCSFLVRDQEGHYRFSHRAFMEFFVARLLYDELPQLGEAAKRKRRLDQFYFHRKKLSHEIYSFLAQMKPDTDLLYSLAKHTKGKTFKGIRYLGANAATVLRHMKFDFRSASLPGTVLCDADFSGLDLTGADFKNANLYTCNFNNCVLDEVNMTGANLAYSSIKGIGGILDLLPFLGTDLAFIASMNSPIYLWKVGEKELEGELVGHSDGVWSLAMVGNQPMIISGGHDHTVRLWDIPILELVRTFEGHFDNVWSVASNLDGSRLASCSSDRTIKVWKPDSPSPEKILKGHTDEVRDIAFISDSILASCGLDGKLIIWHLTEGKQLTWKGVRGFHALAVSTGSKFLALGDTDGWITTFKVDGLEFLWERRIHTGAVRTLAFGPDKHGIASGGGDAFVFITDLFDPTMVRKVVEHKGFVNRVRFIGKDLIISAGYDNLVVITNIESSVQKVHDIRDLIYTSKDRFSCRGLILRDIQGMPVERLQYLKERGATSE